MSKYDDKLNQFCYWLAVMTNIPQRTDKKSTYHKFKKKKFIVDNLFVSGLFIDWHEKNCKASGKLIFKLFFKNLMRIDDES